MTHSPLTYIADDNGTLVRHVRALSDPRAGRVTFVASSSGNPARLLNAMGQDIQGAATTAADLLPWLHGRDISDVFVYGLDRIPLSRASALIETAYLADIRLWLIDAEPGRRALPRWLQRWACPTLTSDEFATRWPAPPSPPSAPPHKRFPEHLPDCDFLLFAGLSRRILQQPGRRVVLEHYWQAFHDHKAWIAATTSLDLSAVAARAWQGIRDNTTPQGAQIAVMALQAALFRAGWSFRIDVAHVAIDHSIIAHTHVTESMSALYRLGDTQQAALALLTLLSRAHPAVLAGVRVDDVGADGATAQIGDERFDCPPVAQHILRAHTMRRRADADGPHLFANTRNAKTYGSQRAATEQHLQEVLYHTARKTGLPLGRNGVARAPDSAWIRQRRLRLRRL